MLHLRQAAADDVAYLAALAADPQVEPFLSFAAADEDRLLTLLSAPGPAPGSGGLMVIESSDGGPLGGLALTVVNARSRICDISRVMVAPDSRRSGVALTAIRLAATRCTITACTASRPSVTATTPLRIACSSAPGSRARGRGAAPTGAVAAGSTGYSSDSTLRSSRRRRRRQAEHGVCVTPFDGLAPKLRK
ncbi:MAG: GNAT family N-acetyltransferase [Solirubrobacteraceae bacterium]